MLLRIKWFRSGEYIVAGFFASYTDGSMATLGTLRMDEPAWQRFKDSLIPGCFELCEDQPR